MKRIEWWIMAVVFFLYSAGLSFASTKDEVEKRGFLQCGVSTGLPGFSNPDAKGNWSGIDIDICRAVAAAVLSDATKVRFKPLAEKERFTSLLSGDIDILSRNTSWTLTRDTAFGLSFVGTNYYDGQGFLVVRKPSIKGVQSLNGMTVCIQPGTSAESNLAEYFKRNKMEYKAVVSDTPEQAIKSLEAGRCDVLTGEQSELYQLRLKLSNPRDAVVLHEVISKKPLGPFVRQGDESWLNIVKWTLFAMINAEELGLNSANVEEMKKNRNPDILSFLGQDGVKGTSLGLRDDWAYRIIRQVGNYGESFERGLGQGSVLKAERGLNALWNQGGILYAPPVR